MIQLRPFSFPDCQIPFTIPDILSLTLVSHTKVQGMRPICCNIRRSKKVRWRKEWQSPHRKDVGVDGWVKHRTFTPGAVPCDSFYLTYLFMNSVFIPDWLFPLRSSFHLSFYLHVSWHFISSLRTISPTFLKAKMTGTIHTNSHTARTTIPYRHTPTRTPAIEGNANPLLSPSLYHPPQGLAPYPHLSAHCHPLLPYYHIWSTTTTTPPYLFTLPHAPPARHAPFSMATLREKKRRMKRQGLSWGTICQGDEEWAGTQLRAAHWACGVSLNVGPSKGMESHE